MQLIFRFQVSALFCFLTTAFPSEWNNSDILKYFNSQIKPFEDPENYDSKILSVDRLYLINLDIRPEKLSYITQHTLPFDIEIIRFPAIYGLSLDPAFLKSYKAAHNRPNFWGRNPGQIGVLLSHLSIMKHMLDKHYNTIWIWEDDIVIKDLSIIMPALEELNFIDPEWDLLYTDAAPYHEGSSKPFYFRDIAYDLISKNYFPKSEVIRVCQPDKSISSKIMKVHSRLGFYSVIISNRGAKKIYEYFSNNLMKFALDIDLPFLDLKMYRVKKISVTHLTKPICSDTTPVIPSNFDS